MVTDRRIEPFRLPVIVKDGGSFYKRYDEFVRLITNDMRDQGFVPIFDVDPFVENGGVVDNSQKFTITVQGVWVGKDRAWKIHGLTKGKEIPMPIRRSKLKQ